SPPCSVSPCSATGCATRSTGRSERAPAKEESSMGKRIVLLPLVAVAIVGLGGLTAPPDARAAGKDFVIGFLGDATSLNPVIATDGQSYIAEWPIFDSLVELDEKLGVRPLLAESWDVSKDGLTYPFHLKHRV